MSNAPLITLLTDFGTSDVFVGVMKGVIHGILPAARIVDLTHDVPPQEAESAAAYLRMSYRYFPAGTVHVVVVDPGVGSERKAIALSCDGHLFVGPDNGLFAPLLEGREWQAVELTEPAYRLAEGSHTFHGRDIFAPAGAHLAAGVPLKALGPPLATLTPSTWPAPQLTARQLTGRIWWIDHFGNLISNLEDTMVAQLAQPWQLRLGEHTVDRLVRCYADSQPGELVALINSFGYLEVAVNGGSAAAKLGCARGTPLTLSTTTSRRP